RRLADVGDNGKRPPPDTDDLCTDFGQPVGATSGEHDVCPGLGQRDSKAGAETGAGTGDHGDPSVKPEQVQHSSHRAISFPGHLGFSSTSDGEAPVAGSGDSAVRSEDVDPGGGKQRYRLAGGLQAGAQGEPASVTRVDTLGDDGSFEKAECSV